MATIGLRKKASSLLTTIILPRFLGLATLDILVALVASMHHDDYLFIRTVTSLYLEY